MSTTLTLVDLTVAVGARTLFTGLDLRVADGDVVAVVGPNGAGKTTLLRTVVGDVAPESGSVRLAPPDASVAWLPQVLPDPAETLLDYTRRRTGVAAADRELEEATDALAAGRSGAEDRYSDVLERWLAIGAADLTDRLPAVAERVGLRVDPDRPVGSLSGGQAARVSLAAVLASRYDVLLLDEPTNDLDRAGRGLMTDFVRSHAGPVLVASHDRAFLDDVATRVVELDLPQQQVVHYTGNHSDYVAQRSLAREQAADAYERYAEERDDLLAQAGQRREWAARGRRGVKSSGETDKHIKEKKRARADKRAAQGARIERAAERLDPVSQPRKEWRLRYELVEQGRSAEVVATFDRAVVRRGDFVLGPVSLVVGRGDRIAVVGENGSGKSTLLAALLGRLPLDEGRHSLGSGVRIGFLDQRRVLDETATLLDAATDELGAAPGTGRLWDPGDVRTLLAKFGLGAEHVGERVATLSMGERTRAQMAVFQGRGVNVLVLDEPTNHLDIEATEQLEEAVAGFTGTVLVVSHDERLLDAIGIADRWLVESGRVTISSDEPTRGTQRGPHRTP